MQQVAIFIWFRESSWLTCTRWFFAARPVCAKDSKRAVEPLKIYVFGNSFSEMPSLKRPRAFFHPLEGYAGRS